MSVRKGQEHCLRGVGFLNKHAAALRAKGPLLTGRGALRFRSAKSKDPAPCSSGLCGAPARTWPWVSLPTSLQCSPSTWSEPQASSGISPPLECGNPACHLLTFTISRWQVGGGEKLVIKKARKWYQSPRKVNWNLVKWRERIKKIFRVAILPLWCCLFLKVMGRDNNPGKEMRHPYLSSCLIHAPWGFALFYSYTSAPVLSLEVRLFWKPRTILGQPHLFLMKRTAPHFRDSKRFLLNAKINTKPLGSSLWEFSLLVSLYFFMLIYKYEQKTQDSRLLSGFVTLWRVAGGELNEWTQSPVTAEPWHFIELHRKSSWIRCKMLIR